MMYTNIIQQVNFSPSQQPGYYDTYYIPSTLDFSMTSKSFIPCQQISGVCPTNMMIPAENPINAVVPPVYHPKSTPTNKFSITYVHLMNVAETAAWIMTLGSFKGWKEAAAYAESFKKNGITGAMLVKLNHELLKFELDILNSSHRIELLHTISLLFPSFTKVVPTADQSALSTVSGMPETDNESDLIVKTIPPSPSFDPRESYTPEAHQVEPCSIQNPKADEYEPCRLDYLVNETNESVRMDMSSIRSNSIRSDSGVSTRSSVKTRSGLSTTSSSTISLDISESNFMKLPLIRTRGSFAQANTTSEDITHPDKPSPKAASVPRRTYADLLREPRAKVNMTSSRSSSETSGTTCPFKTTTPNKPSKLLLTSSGNQFFKTDNIQNHFLKFNFVVRVEPSKRRNCFVIVFHSITDAKDALNLQRQIGYRLEPYHEKARKIMRPTPKNPIEYRVLSKVTVRSGKSLHGDIVGELFKNTIVTINKIKGRRARIIRKRGTMDPLTVGWVSSHTDEGIPLLEQVRG